MHIGLRIKQILDTRAKSHTVTWFARQLNCNRRNVYHIFERNTIDTDLLRRISEILHHNFFQDLADDYTDPPPRREKAAGGTEEAGESVK